MEYCNKIDTNQVKLSCLTEASFVTPNQLKYYFSPSPTVNATSKGISTTYKYLIIESWQQKPPLLLQHEKQGGEIAELEILGSIYIFLVLTASMY